VLEKIGILVKERGSIARYMKTTLLKQNSAVPVKAFALRFRRWREQRIYTSAKAISVPLGMGIAF